MFHDRLNYFSVLEVGLFTACAILYNKDVPVKVLFPLAGVGLVFTLLWWAIQWRHWKYVAHIFRLSFHGAARLYPMAVNT